MSLKRYSIWDKTSHVITPSGEVFTAREWKERYPVASIPSITIVGSAGDINGAFFGVLSQMVSMYADQGCDFSGCTNDIEKLEAIEAFEDSINHPIDTGESTPEERIAAALEMQNILSMETVNTDDPDVD